MISITGNMPVLQIGRRQVTDYSTDWIGESLGRAAERTDSRDVIFLDEIRDGILHYLQNRCSLRLLTLEALHARMQGMLHHIGLPAIAGKLPLVAPPLTVSLADAAERAGNGFELVFFKILREEVEDLYGHGVEVIDFAGLEECVRILRGTKKNTLAARRLAGDITHFLGGFGQPEKGRWNFVAFS